MQDRTDDVNRTQTDQPEPATPPEEPIADAGDALEADFPDEALAPDETTRIEPPRAAPAGVVPPTPTARRRMPFRRPSDTSVGSPARPRSYVSRDSSWFWPLANLVGLVAVIVVAWLANWLPFNDHTTAGIIDRNPVPFQPATWTFAIWGLIEAVLLVFVVYGFLPMGRLSPRVQAVGPFFLVANVASIVWFILWHWEQFAGSLVTLVVLLAALVGIYVVVRRRGRDAPEVGVAQRLIVWTPFSLFLGWVSLLTLINLQMWMAHGGWNGGPFGLRAWAVIFLLAGALVAAGVGFFFHDAAYTVVFVWGYLGIAQAQWGASKLVSVTAILAVIIAAAVTVMAFILAFDRRSMEGGAFSALRRRTPAPPTGV